MAPVTPLHGDVFVWIWLCVLWVEMALGGDGLWVEMALESGLRRLWRVVVAHAFRAPTLPHFLTGGKHAFLCMASMLRTDGETRRFRSAGIDQGVGGAEGGEGFKFRSRGAQYIVKAA